MDHTFYLLSRRLPSFESYYRSGGRDGHWGTPALSCSASSSGKTYNAPTNKARAKGSTAEVGMPPLLRMRNYFLSYNKPCLHQGPTTRLHPKLLDPYTFLRASLTLSAHILWGWDSNLSCKSPSHMRRVQVLFLVVSALQLLEMPPPSASRVQLETFRLFMHIWIWVILTMTFHFCLSRDARSNKPASLLYLPFHKCSSLIVKVTSSLCLTWGESGVSNKWFCVVLNESALSSQCSPCYQRSLQ